MMTIQITRLFWFLLLPMFAIQAAGKESAPLGEKSQSLNGEWHFTIDPEIAKDSTATWDRITVPGNWEVQEKFRKHRGNGWYRTEFTVPSDWKGKRLRLRFEAVYHEAEVTLNGQELGIHTGGYTPFEFDVTNQVNFGGPNTVLVRADNSYRRGAWWPWGGISRDVTLIANNDARIVWQHIHAEPDLKTGTARVAVKYKLVNGGERPIEATIEGSFPETSAPLLRKTVTLAPKSETIIGVETLLPARDVRLWHFDHPNLYHLSSRLSSGKRILHEKDDRFGIRKVEVTKEGLFLNGERVRVAGFNRVSDSNETGNLEPDTLVRKDVDLMKKAGAVFSRLSHTPLAPNLLDYLDEKGMMVFCEIPVWGWDEKQVKRDNPLTKQWLREMIERDYNHPCIIGWSPGNEITGHYNYVESMNRYIRTELDPQRLVSYVSNTAYLPDYHPTNDPVTVSDIAMINCYGKPGDGFRTAGATTREKWPDKPVFFSEFGARQIGNNLDAGIPDIEGIWREITKDPFVIGGSLWTFNDYRSEMNGTPTSGNRAWGVVNVNREPKRAYWQVRKIYSPVRSLEIEKGAVVIHPRSPEEAPSYTLRGYHLEWTLCNDSGKEISAGRIEVPYLAPGAGVWRAMIPGAEGAVAVSISLVTPTGYKVADIRSGEPGK